MHYYIASIEEQDGEQLHKFPILFRCTLPAQAAVTANQIISSWYEESDDDKDDDEYGATPLPLCAGLREIPEDHFNLMVENGYLSDDSLKSS